jgi:hypothetical protein
MKVIKMKPFIKFEAKRHLFSLLPVTPLSRDSYLVEFARGQHGGMRVSDGCHEVELQVSEQEALFRQLMENESVMALSGVLLRLRGAAIRFKHGHTLVLTCQRAEIHSLEESSKEGSKTCEIHTDEEIVALISFRLQQTLRQTLNAKLQQMELDGSAHLFPAISDIDAALMHGGGKSHISTKHTCVSLHDEIA